MNSPIYDLHCDLLSYLELPNADAENGDEIGCAMPHLRDGNVRFQTMAIFTLTGPESRASFQRQIELYHRLQKSYPVELKHVANAQDLAYVESGAAIGMALAVENASGLCGEDEPLETVYAELEKMIAAGQKPFYITLTHTAENRFGGGNHTGIGLKPDGEAFLTYLSGKNIAIDFSHTSDQLAWDIFHYLDAHQLDLPLLASHSNFRVLQDNNRNLPEDIVAELARRNAVVGINFVRAFVDDDNPDRLYDHIIHGWKKMNGKLVFGADFFPAVTLSHLIPPDRYPIFHPEHENAAVYPVILQRLAEKMSAEAIEQFAWKNASRWIKERIG